MEEAQALDELSAHVRANRDHEKMNTRGIPYLPNELLRAWSAYSPDGFREAMEGYDGHVSVSGSLNFDYCDIVADFYDVVVDLVAPLSDVTDIAIAEESILKQPKEAAWYAESALTRPLAAPIADAFRESLKTAD